MKDVYTRGARPHSETGDRDDFALFGQPQHDRGNAGEIDDVGLQHIETDSGGNARVDGVAAGFEAQKPAWAAP